MVQGQRKPVVGVSLLTQQGQFHRELKVGMERAGRANGLELLFQVADFDSGAQCAHIDAFVTRKVDAIIFTPCASAAAGTSIEQANRARIPIFTADIASTSPTGAVTSHIASDNVLGGRRAAELMIAALKGSGHVMVAVHPGVTSVVERVRGFREAIVKAPGIRIMGEMPAWNDPRNQMAVQMKDLLAKMPSLNAVFCTNDEIALGTLAALEATQKLGKIVIVGYDVTAEVRAAIEKGTIYGGVVQFPVRMGELAVKAVRDHLSGASVPKQISVDVGVLTAAGERG